MGSKSVKVEWKLKFMLFWLSCGQTTTIGKPLCCLYSPANCPTNWINCFLLYERALQKMTKTTAPHTIGSLLTNNKNIFMGHPVTTAPHTIGSLLTNNKNIFMGHSVTTAPHTIGSLLTNNKNIPYSGKFSRGPIFAEGQTSSISRSNFRGWPFQNCSAHNTWLTPPFTACARRLKNSAVGVLPGSYATFLQNELLSIKAHRFFCFCFFYIINLLCPDIGNSK